MNPLTDYGAAFTVTLTDGAPVLPNTHYTFEKFVETSGNTWQAQEAEGGVMLNLTLVDADTYAVEVTDGMATWYDAEHYTKAQLEAGFTGIFTHTEDPAYMELQVQIFREEIDPFSGKNLSVQGVSSEGEILWPLAGNGTFTTFVKNWPNYTWSNENATHNIQQVGVGLYAVRSDTLSITWNLFGEVGFIEFQEPATPLTMQTGEGGQASDAIVSYLLTNPVAQGPVEVPPEFKKSDMPRAHTALADYGRALITQGVNIGAEVAAFVQALSSARNPLTRSAVSVEGLREADRALRLAIKTGVMNQAREFFQAGAGAPAPKACTLGAITQTPGQLELAKPAGRPANSKGKKLWFEVEIWYNLPEKVIAISANVTRFPFKGEIPPDAWGRVLTIRGRWAWQTAQGISYGPYSNLQRVTAVIPADE